MAVSYDRILSDVMTNIGGVQQSGNNNLRIKVILNFNVIHLKLLKWLGQWYSTFLVLLPLELVNKPVIIS